jgi:hypothetical protein
LEEFHCFVVVFFMFVIEVALEVGWFRTLFCESHNKLHSFPAVFFFSLQQILSTHRWFINLAIILVWCNHVTALFITVITNTCISFSPLWRSRF